MYRIDLRQLTKDAFGPGGTVLVNAQLEALAGRDLVIRWQIVGSEISGSVLGVDGAVLAAFSGSATEVRTSGAFIQADGAVGEWRWSPDD